jgi:hypothetical protein
LEVIPGRELQERRVEADGIPDALEHGAAQIVVQQGSGHGIEEGEGRHVSMQEAAHCRVEVKAQEQMARVTQHHHEGHQRSACAADVHFSKVSPVNLSLFSRQGA